MGEILSLKSVFIALLKTNSIIIWINNLNLWVYLENLLWLLRIRKTGIKCDDIKLFSRWIDFQWFFILFATLIVVEICIVSPNNKFNQCYYMHEHSCLFRGINICYLLHYPLSFSLPSFFLDKEDKIERTLWHCLFTHFVFTFLIISTTKKAEVSRDNYSWHLFILCISSSSDI